MPCEILHGMQKLLLAWFFNALLRKACEILHRLRNSISLVCRACEISHRLRNSLFLNSQGLQDFAQVMKFIFLSLGLCPAAGAPFAFCIAMRNCWKLDFFFASHSCILDWFWKGYKAFQSLDSSCAWAFILLCHGLYKFLSHSWLI